MSEKSFEVTVHISGSVRIKGNDYKAKFRSLSQETIVFSLDESLSFGACKANFELDGKAFALNATLLRKDQSMPGKIYYRCALEEMEEKQRKTLMHVLFRLDSIRNK